LALYLSRVRSSEVSEGRPIDLDVEASVRALSVDSIAAKLANKVITE
jgi:hypothetical protein